MTDDNTIKLLIESMGIMLDKENEPNPILRALIKDTIQFRDKLKEDTGQILTVNDTKTALEALEGHLNGEKFPKNLTPEQKVLAQIYIDRVVLFKYQ